MLGDAVSETPKHGELQEQPMSTEKAKKAEEGRASSGEPKKRAVQKAAEWLLEFRKVRTLYTQNISQESRGGPRRVEGMPQEMKTMQTVIR
eukprot:892501-Pyramimonas_sp.AAC.1